MIDPFLPEPLGLGSCRIQIGADAIVILARCSGPPIFAPLIERLVAAVRAFALG